MKKKENTNPKVVTRTISKISSHCVFLNKLVTKLSHHIKPDEPKTGGDPASPAIKVLIAQNAERKSVMPETATRNTFFLSISVHGRLKMNLKILFPNIFFTSLSRLFTSLF